MPHSFEDLRVKGQGTHLPRAGSKLSIETARSGLPLYMMINSSPFGWAILC